MRRVRLGLASASQVGWPRRPGVRESRLDANVSRPIGDRFGDLATEHALPA